MSNFVKFRPVGAKLFHAEGQKNGETRRSDMTKLTVAFRERSFPFQLPLECRKPELQTALSLAGDAYDVWYRVTPPDSAVTGRYRISVLLVGHPASYLWQQGFVQRSTISYPSFESGKYGYGVPIEAILASFHISCSSLKILQLGKIFVAEIYFTGCQYWWMAVTVVLTAEYSQSGRYPCKTGSNIGAWRSSSTTNDYNKAP